MMSFGVNTGASQSRCIFVHNTQNVWEFLSRVNPSVPHDLPRLDSGSVGLGAHYNRGPVASNLPMPVAPSLSVSATPPTPPISGFPVPRSGPPSGDSPLPPVRLLGDHLGVILPPLNPELLTGLRDGPQSPMSPVKKPPNKKQRLEKTDSKSKKNVPDQSNVKSSIDEHEMIKRLGITPEKYKQISGRNGFNLMFNMLVENDGENLTKLTQEFTFTPDQLVRILNADYANARIEFILKSDVVPFLLNRGFDHDEIVGAFSHVGVTNRFIKLMAPAPGLSKYIHFIGDFNGHIISPKTALDIFNALISSGALNKQGLLNSTDDQVLVSALSDLKSQFHLTDDQIDHIQWVVAHDVTRFDTIKILFPEKQHLQCLFFNIRSITPDNIDWLFQQNSDGQPLNIDKLLKVIHLLSTGIEKNNDIIKDKFSDRLFDLCNLFSNTSSADFFTFLLETDPRTGQSPLAYVLRDRDFDIRSIVMGTFLRSGKPFGGVPVSNWQFKGTFEEYYNEMIKFKGHVEQMILTAESMRPQVKHALT